MIRGSARLRRHCVLETESLQVEGLDKGIQEADRIVRCDVLVQRLGEQGQLVAVQACDVCHRLPPARFIEQGDLPLVTPEFSHSLSLQRTRAFARAGDSVANSNWFPRGHVRLSPPAP